MESVVAPPGRDTYQNPYMAAVFSVPMRRATSHQGTTVKELEDLMNLSSELTHTHLWAEC